jgi:uncharacterized alpha-E superfamily protein
MLGYSGKRIKILNYKGMAQGETAQALLRGELYALFGLFLTLGNYGKIECRSVILSLIMDTGIGRSMVQSVRMIFQNARMKNMKTSGDKESVCQIEHEFVLV